MFSPRRSLCGWGSSTSGPLLPPRWSDWWLSMHSGCKMTARPIRAGSQKLASYLHVSHKHPEDKRIHRQNRGPRSSQKICCLVADTLFRCSWRRCDCPSWVPSGSNSECASSQSRYIGWPCHQWGKTLADAASAWCSRWCQHYRRSLWAASQAGSFPSFYW